MMDSCSEFAPALAGIVELDKKYVGGKPLGICLFFADRPYITRDTEISEIAKILF
jgi:hypothetical protein